MAGIDIDELHQLHALAGRAARVTSRPAWARILNDAAHAATRMAAGPDRYASLDDVVRGLREVKAELGRRDLPAGDPDAPVP